MEPIDAPGAALSLPTWCVDRVLYDRDGFLVVDKPGGIPVHGGDESLQGDCVARLGAWLSAEGRSDYLAVHQRLDQDTSGALFFVTDPEKNPAVANAMQVHSIRRTYLAVVEATPQTTAPLSRTHHRSEKGNGKMPHGQTRRDAEGQFGGGAPQVKGARAVGSRTFQAPLAERGTIDVHLLHERGISKVVPASTSDAKRAVTHFVVKKRVGSRCLLELTLETGRTHQIRISLAHLGYPIVGDTLYGGSAAPRLYLHAHQLSGAPLPALVAARVPDDFDACLSGEGIDVAAIDLVSKVRDAAVFRAPLLAETAAFRLLNGDGDGTPGLTVDVFGRFATLNIYEPAWQARLEELNHCLLRLGVRGVYLKQRVRSDLRQENVEHLAPDVPVAGVAAPSSYLVCEHQMHLNIEMTYGLSTGLFVDMRNERRRVRQLLEGKETPRMLNLFCYTGSFSVAAALAGASTTSVDLSGRAIARVRQNFASNQLAEQGHRFFKEDAMKYLQKAVRRGEQYQMIVLDPPSFATVGKGTFSVSARYVEAAADCFRLLSPGGYLLCVTNHLKTSESAFYEIVKKAARQAGRELSSIRSLPSSLDCPRGTQGPFPSKAVLALAR